MKKYSFFFIGTMLSNLQAIVTIYAERSVARKNNNYGNNGEQNTSFLQAGKSNGKKTKKRSNKKVLDTDTDDGAAEDLAPPEEDDSKYCAIITILSSLFSLSVAAILTGIFCFGNGCCSCDCCDSEGGGEGTENGGGNGKDGNNENGGNTGNNGNNDTKTCTMAACQAEEKDGKEQTLASTASEGGACPDGDCGKCCEDVVPPADPTCEAAEAAVCDAGAFKDPAKDGVACKSGASCGSADCCTVAFVIRS